jgi:hypothetical protein
MAKVLYNSKRIIPVRFVTIQKQYQTTEDGTKVGSVFNLSIQGTIFAYKGSPDEDGNFYSGGGFYEPDGRSQPTAIVDIADDARFAAIIRKQEAIRNLFSEDGHVLEFQSFDGSQPMKCNPRILDVSFQEGIWYDTCDYTITCECDILSVNGVALGEDEFDEYISSASESWSLESQEEPENENIPRTYRLTHSLSAKGKRYYQADGTLTKPAWQWARDWVVPRLGLDNAYLTSSGVQDLPSYFGGFNHLRSEQIDENGGNYSVTESWLLASGSALEDFSVNIRTNSSDGLTNVSIEGSIRGLETRNSAMVMTNSKWENALSKFSVVSGLALTRAQAYGGMSLNMQPLSTTIGKNPAAGTISYSFEYDNRASNMITGAKSEVISIVDNFDVDVFAAIPVLGRQAGPVLQNIGTHKEASRTLSIELVFGPELAGSGSATSQINTRNPRFYSPYKEDIQAVVNAANPVLCSLPNNIGQAASTAYVADQSYTWEPKTGRMSYTTTWVFE